MINAYLSAVFLYTVTSRCKESQWDLNCPPPKKKKMNNLVKVPSAYEIFKGTY